MWNNWLDPDAPELLTSFLAIFGVVFLNLEVLKRFMLPSHTDCRAFRVCVCVREWVSVCVCVCVTAPLSAPGSADSSPSRLSARLGHRSSPAGRRSASLPLLPIYLCLLPPPALPSAPPVAKTCASFLYVIEHNPMFTCFGFCSSFEIK